MSFRIHPPYAAIETPQNSKQPTGIGDEQGRTSQQMSNVRQISGEIESVDATSLTLTIRETRPGWKSTETTRFIMSTHDTRVMDSQGEHLVQLGELKAGDRAQIQFTVDTESRCLARQIIVFGSTRN